MLGALDDMGVITNIGEHMSNLPLDPCLSRMLLESVEDGMDCMEEVCILKKYHRCSSVLTPFWLVYMETYGIDFLTPSFVICISKHHHQDRHYMYYKN